MLESIISYLRLHPDGVSSQELAEVFLKFKSPDPLLAHKAVGAILKTDNRCFFDSGKQWRAIAKQRKGTPLLEMQFTAVFCLHDPSRCDKRAFFISLWDVNNHGENILNCWLVHSQQFSSEMREMFSEDIDPTDTVQSSDKAAGNIYEVMGSSIPIFVSPYECALVHNTLMQSGYYPSEDYLLVSDLLKASGTAVPHPLTLQTFLSTLEIQPVPPGELRKCGATLQAGIKELLQIIVRKGIETREQLEGIVYKDCNQYFEGKEFSFKSVQSLPVTPGVYGFKNKQGIYIYIGKAKSLKRRLLGYFRDTDESPDKIRSLRQEAHTLVTYQCGSELEALIYEFRLIRKHVPSLNSKIDISERKGTYQPVQDCIIVLPHVKNEFAMSFWLRKNQKMVMKPIELNNFNAAAVIPDLNNYFFESSLPAEPTDFPELEVATRWIKSHRDELTCIDVYNCADADEIAESLGILIKQYQNL